MELERNLNENIIMALETIPGVLGFKPIVDEDKEFIKCFVENKYLDISLGLIISRNITSKAISNEILEAIKFFLKKKKINYVLRELKIYIKGVK
ncbi:hypothetical protein ACJA28_03160 [Mesomycoplasma moatsii]|uniref:hypothetical protein n=1 Tax=Mesomycoplasma moatsii TaxID=171287 RepID=UPI0038738411